MLVSTIKSISKTIPDTQFTVVSIFPELDRKNCNIENINIIKENTDKLKALYYILSAILWRVFHIDLNKHDLLNEYINSDIIIDLSGDGFSDDYGSMASISSCYDILLCKLLKKPFVIYAQSIGPFKTIFTRYLSRFCLNLVDLLIVRDEITEKYLKNMGVNNKIYFTADSAFLLEASPRSRIEEILLKEHIDMKERPLIGISVSQHLYDLESKKVDSKKDNNYLNLMSKVVDLVIDKFNAQVVFVPHVTNDARPIDDRFVARKIYEISKNKNRIKLIDDEYSAEELKGIIGQCDLFIGARMHANIAATSMNVPTLAIAYSHKYYGIMGMLKMENYVLDFRSMTFNEMAAKIDELWDKKGIIKKELETNVNILKERSLHNVELVKVLVSSSSPHKI